MANSVDRHLDAKTIEKYSLDKLSANQLAESEMHLLVCGPCRQAVTDSDAYVAAMRKAAAKFRKAEQWPKRQVAAN